jgi:hypothetical protein
MGDGTCRAHPGERFPCRSRKAEVDAVAARLPWTRSAVRVVPMPALVGTAWASSSIVDRPRASVRSR